jgi:hypothetical protein
MPNATGHFVRASEVDCKLDWFSTWVVRTDEDLMIDRHTQHVLGASQRNDTMPLAHAA